MRRTPKDLLQDVMCFIVGTGGALIVLLLLTGCADVVYKTERVEIPVPVPCLSAVPPEPVWALSDPSLSHQGRREKAEALVREMEQREAHLRELRALLERCARP